MSHAQVHARISLATKHDEGMAMCRVMHGTCCLSAVCDAGILQHSDQMGGGGDEAIGTESCWRADCPCEEKLAGGVQICHQNWGGLPKFLVSGR